ncbi:hypothetical protein BCR33DRAFT_455865 [Rhizoclosmatium globosum]|uniref:SP-RING-type domain-containing protein n=1 Tax=Rhizoclosmatium globosum TaxID=329046 RepID=A0A1Y2CX71_9FUNG|nr:hypothetical protein BCR33DRAFT_455865 [Rhizoclosmatium globosum]|eukprot:ORY51486.1 hypothetical protein BCR33DRAFT_455865 [Rhizoclosmatium globosum]
MLQERRHTASNRLAFMRLGCIYKWIHETCSDSTEARIIEVGGDFVANLTPFLRNGLNVLTIITNGTEEIDNYIIAVDFVALVTEARLRYDLGISKHTFSIDGSIQKLNAILDKFQQDDDIIMEESIDISLNCPLVGMRMDFPVRTTNCTHFQCFEMNSWLAMKHIHDVCPVCRCSFRAENIEVDVFQAFLCKFIPNSITTVTLLREGDIVCKGLGGNEMQVLKGKWQEMLKNARTTTGNASTNETDRPNKRAKTVK